MHLSCFVRWGWGGGGGEEDGESLLSCHPTLPSPGACPPPELIGGACVEFRAVVGHVRDGDAGMVGMLWDGARAGERAKVTGACPPSPTARMPSPRPLHLKTSRGMFL